jgi:hypothetical protein
MGTTDVTDDVSPVTRFKCASLQLVGFAARLLELEVRVDLLRLFDDTL